MANQQHIELFTQGVEAWNQWRHANRDILPDLSGAHFEHMQLSGIRLSFASLQKTSFHHTQLKGAYFVRADLSETNFDSAFLSEAHLDSAQLINANLRHAQLEKAKLRITNVSGSDLRNANLSYANLDRAVLNNAQLDEADLHFARIGGTSLVNVDLSKVVGLDTVIHERCSYLGLRTLARSACQIPASFLHGTGTPREFVTAACFSENALQHFTTCFILYAHKNEDFVRQLSADLRGNGILCHVMPFEEFVAHEHDIYQQITVYDKFLPVISAYMMTDSLYHLFHYAQKEALAKEAMQQTPVLLRIYLDRSLEERKPAWIRLTAGSRWPKHCDFTGWPEVASYRRSLEQLLQLLEL